MIERLENRRLLAAAIVNPGANGVLQIDGTNANDTIDLSVTAEVLSVVINGGGAQTFDISEDLNDGEFHSVVINGATGNDEITLANTVFGVPGAAGIVINGDSGDDTITGGAGDDTINGGADNDSLEGGDGSDTLDGGSGADTMIGDDGYDTVTYESRTSAVFVTFDPDLDPQIANDGQTGELDLIELSVDEVIGGNGNDVLTDQTTGGKRMDGGEGNDTIVGGLGSNEILGGGGNDFMTGEIGGDTFDGGGGTDTVSYDDHGNAVTVTLDGVANDGETGENDNVLANVENIVGSDFNDSISVAGTLIGHNLDGGIGNDTLTGGTVTDTLLGGDGNDSLLGGAGGDSLIGGIGIDVIRGEDGNDTATGGDGNDSLYGGAGTDSLSGDAGNDYLVGDAGNDTLVGGDNNDRLLGGADADSLLGGAGDDQLAPGRGKDTLSGGIGTDRADYSYEAKPVIASIDGAANDGTKGEQDNISTDVEDIRGGTGNDTFTGSGAKNYLIGGGGNDTLIGNGGSDILSGDAGNDSLVGGNGNDRLRGGLGTDRLIGGANNDLADFTDHTANLTITLDGVANDGAAGENDFIGADVESVLGGTGNDNITGSAGINLIRGGDGNDTITPGAGRDTVFGDLGNDTFNTIDGVIDTIGDHLGTDVVNKDSNDIVQ